MFTQRLAHQLTEQGNRVVVVTSRPSPDAPSHETQEDGVEVYRLPCWSFLDGRLPISHRNREYEAMLSEIAELGIDRILVNVRFYRNSLEGVRFARRIGAPVIVLDHGSAHLTLGNGLLDRLVERYEHAVTNRMKRLGPAFAGISRASANWLSHFEIETSTVIPNAVDVGGVASPRDFRAELHALGKVLVVSVGRLEPEKGALQFAQAAPLLGDGFVLALAGEGSQRVQIDKLHAGNVFLLGQLDQSDLSALLRDADVFCLPTRSEGFCTSLLEAAAQGAIPVIPHVGGTDEVMGWNPVHHGVMLKDNEPEAVAQAIREAAEQDGIAVQELREHVAMDCTWDATVKALEDAFAALD